tara:strand:- start:4400 stop:6310 length:1911 start_codon:yes stop_codon:yes gene_type:complete
MKALAEKIEVKVEEPDVTIEVVEDAVEDEDEIEDGVEDETEEDVDTSVELAVPQGGIGGFAMSEEDLSVLEAEEAKKEFGEKGLAQFTAVAKKMSGHGRFGDDSVAHIQTGEMVIPITLLKNNPALKKQILKELRENGYEDPEQYIVGDSANSINPHTGLMEFGGLKSIIRGIGKFLRKVVPIILPIVLAFTPLGPIYGAAVGAGIGTLISGGDLGDAFKSALIAGATGAVFQGFSGTEGSFGANVKAGLASPSSRVAQTLEGAKAGASGAGWKGEGNLFSDYVPTPSAELVNATAATAAPLVPGPIAVGADFNIGAAGPDLTLGGTAAPITAGSPINTAPINTAGAPGTTTGGAGTTGVGTAAPGALVTPPETPGFFNSLKAAIVPGDGVGFTEGLGNAFFPKTVTGSDVLTMNGINPLAASTSAAQQSAAKAIALKASPNMMRTYAPALGLATLVAGATGGFDDPNKDGGPSIVDLNEDGSVVTGVDLLAADPGKYLIHDLGASRLNQETGEYEPVERSATPEVRVPTKYPMTKIQPSTITPADYLLASDPDGPFSRPYVQKADGGPIYPRRNGGVAPSEGVPGQDSVRAMLMPGEFVMTTDAVKGLGNGNLDNGIKSMYSVMRNLESRGRATA